VSFTLDQVRVLGARLVVTRPEPLEGYHENATTTGGLVLPTTHRRREWGQVATVTSVGPGVREPIKVGDQVVIGEFSGVPIFDGSMVTDHWVIGEGEIMCILPPAAS